MLLFNASITTTLVLLQCSYYYNVNYYNVFSPIHRVTSLTIVLLPELTRLSFCTPISRITSPDPDVNAHCDGDCNSSELGSGEDGSTIQSGIFAPRDRRQWKRWSWAGNRMTVPWYIGCWLWLSLRRIEAMAYPISFMYHFNAASLLSSLLQVTTNPCRSFLLTINSLTLLIY